VQVAEESPSVEAVAREQLVATVTDGGHYSVSVICKCSSEWCIKKVVNKLNSSNPYPVSSHTTLNTWQYVVTNSLLLYIHYVASVSEVIFHNSQRMSLG
jgi:hypothetical protein